MESVIICLFTVHSHYYSLLILGTGTLEIDFPVFIRRIPFYKLLENGHKHTEKGKGADTFTLKITPLFRSN